MATREQHTKAIGDEQNAIAFYEQLKTLTDDEKHIESLNRVIAQSHKSLRDLEGRYGVIFGDDVVSPPLEKLRGRAFSVCMRRAWNACKWG
jgi:hypothetical protein